jgi:hypothetical protein
MALPMWIGFGASQHLKCWYCHEEQDWVQLGEVVTVENLISPMVFSVPKSQLEFTWQHIKSQKIEEYFDVISDFSFVLKRDDSTFLPVYEIGTSPTKLMAVFGEFSDAVNRLVLALSLGPVSFESIDQPGAFKLQVRFSPCSNVGEVFRILGLLRAGIEILSYTRGFQMSDFHWGDLAVDESLFLRLQERLCS